ncbi:MAG: HlyD family efflux transporter periplasmic adaptor subunit [Pseudomonadota bacterium]
MAEQPKQPPADSLTVLLELERSARHARDGDALQHTVVNETRRLIAYRRAVLVDGDTLRVRALSGVATVERDAPFVQWLERVCREVAGSEAGSTLGSVRVGKLPDGLQKDWGSFTGGEVLWLPLRHPDGSVSGYLWLDREQPWSEPELVLLQRLAETYAHAMTALSCSRRRRFRVARRWWLVVAVVVLATLSLPVSQTALAPAEVVPREPLVVSAPIEGVVEEVLVEPNEPVSAGTPLFRFEDVELRSRLEVAQKTLSVARAEAKAAAQGAFEDRKSSARLAVLRTRVALRQAERDYAMALLDRVTVTAQRDGVVIFRDPDDWEGRPVSVGERVMLLADPVQVEVQADLPVGDAIALEKGGRVRLFLDAEPLHPRDGSVARASYEAEVTEQGILAYRLTVLLAGGEAPPRIGLQGTAKLYGEDVPLILYLLRRPISAARQYLGW